MPDAAGARALIHETAADAGSAALPRALPHNIEAEQGLLASILVNNRAFQGVCDFLRPEHFAEPVHGRIFAAIARLIEGGHVANPITLKNRFDQDGALAEIGGGDYLRKLFGSVITIINTPDYGRTIYELYLRRELIGIGQDIINDAHDQTEERNALEQIEGVERRLFDLGSAKADGGLAHVSETTSDYVAAVDRAVKAGGRMVGLTTGLSDLDELIGGLQQGLIIVGARPSMGKTALATTIAKAAATAIRDVAERDGVRPRHVAFFSLEMSAEQINARFVAELSGISAQRQQSGRLSGADVEEFLEAVGRLKALPISVDFTPMLTAGKIRRRARRLARQHGLALIIIDHLQLTRGDPARSDGKPENRNRELGDTTVELAALAKELGVPVVALSQLSRGVEGRQDKRPTLADLRDSGEIEQNADIVTFLYRPSYYLDRSEPTHGDGESETAFNDRYQAWERKCDDARGIAEIIVAKARNGQPIR